MITRTEPLVERAAQRPAQSYPLWDVFRWELFRMAHNRWGWLLPIVMLLGGMGLFMLIPPADVVGFESPSTFSAQHIALSIFVYTLFFLMMVPFLVGDLIARDLKRRMHEVVMATMIPTWAYVWGRYLAGLLVTSGLSAMFVAGGWLAGYAHYITALQLQAPSPERIVASGLSALLLWTVVLLPRVLLVSGLTFTLITLLPRAADVIKPVVAIAWIGSVIAITVLVVPGVRRTVLTPTMVLDALPPLIFWDPTASFYSMITNEAYKLLTLQAFEHANIPFVPPRTIVEYQQARQSMSPDQVNQIHAVIAHVSLQVPDLAAWIPPAAGFVALGLVAVALSAIAFRRFRDALN